MVDQRVRDLGFETAGQILETVGNSGTSFAALGLDGELFWRSHESPRATVMRSITEALETGMNVEGGVRAVGARGQVALYPICNLEDSPLAWLVGWTEAEVEAGDCPVWKRVCETLPRVADALTRECKLANELSGAVNELSDRYEELNVVFRMERESRVALTDQLVIPKMLDGFLDHLRSDVGLLLLEGRDDISGRGTDRKIPNVDLVLTELRGSIWRYISASKCPLVINDASDERRGYLLKNMPYKLMAIPSETCESPEAALLLLRDMDAPDFTNSDMNLTRVFFSQTLILARNQSLIDRMSQFTRHIASSLVEAVEAKDPYTRGHSERVELITGRIGRESGVPSADFADLLWGALLHDIGKIGIPDAILMKPGRLTDDEYTFIKTHPNRSYEILRHIEALGPAALDGARFHQEKFDGTGYPFGLAGREIPLVARVIAIADTYDAVTTSRSYRSAMKHEEAMEIVRDCAGSQLDPDLVDTFDRLVQTDLEWLAEIRPHRARERNG